MTGDDWSSMLWSIVVLVAVISSLMARRLPATQLLTLAAAWIAIFGVLYVALLYRDAFTGIGHRVMADIDPEAPRQAGRAIEIVKAADGHFWVRGQVNGVATRFLVDSGATTIALSSATVAAARLQPQAFANSSVDTANGPVAVTRVTIDTLSVGGIARADLTAVTAPEFGDTNVLGMNFLSSLSGWSVDGSTLVLGP